MGIIKKAIAKHTERKDNRQNARIERKGSRVDSKNRARENKVNLKYAPQVQAAEQNIDTVAQDTDQSAETVAQNILMHPTTQKQLRGYIERKGQVPMDKPIDAAVQGGIIYAGDIQQRRDQDIEQVMNSTNAETEEMDDDDFPLEDYIDEIAEEEFLGRNTANFDGTDPDNFLSPAAMAALQKGTQTLITKVNEQRKQNGKKPLPSLDTIVNGNVSDPTAVGAAAAALEDEYISQKKKEEIKKMMPAIILGVIALIAFGATIAWLNKNHS